MHNEREPWLDGVRGIAVTLVLVAHAYAFAPSGAVQEILAATARAGWVGVEVFFVLSGYLITRILVASKNERFFFRNFYTKRSLRILPAYMVVVAFVFFVLPGLWDKPDISENRSWAWIHIFYAQNLVPVVTGDGAPWKGVHHLWSLAVEEHFYLAWPVVVFLTPVKHLAKVCAAVICLALLTKFLFVQHADWPYASYIHSLARMDALAPGALVSCYPKTNPALSRLITLIALISAVIWITIWAETPHIGRQNAGQIAMIVTVTPLFFACIMHKLVTARGQRTDQLLSLQPLRFMGQYSYGIYLYHMPIMVSASAWLPTAISDIGSSGAAGQLLVRSLIVLITLMVAVASYHVLEEPFLRLKNRLTQEPSLSQQPPLRASLEN